MKWRWMAVIVLLGIAALACESSSLDGAGDSSADFRSRTFSSPEGDTATLADFDGQPMVVNFFAAWCPPCRAELPELEAFHLAHNEQIQLIGISHDLSRSSWLSLISDTDLTFPTYYQPGQEIFTDLELFIMPTTILVTADGELAHTHGGVLDVETLRGLVDEHLGVTLPVVESG